MSGLTTSLTLCRKHGSSDLTKSLALAGVGDDTPIPLLHILANNGPEDCLWALRAVPKSQAQLRDQYARLIACDLAASVLHLFEREHPTDRRPRDAIMVAERYANDEATESELTAAWDATMTAAWEFAQGTARAAARVATWAAAPASASAPARAADFAVITVAARNAACAAEEWADVDAAHANIIRARLIEAGGSQ